MKRIAVALALFIPLACGEPSLEERLSQTEAALAESREAVREAREGLESREKAAEAARLEVEDARKALAEAEQKLVEAESQVDLGMTDALLFRAVQRRLLEEDQLQDVAIRAEVERGVVTLHGRADDPEISEVAVAIAQAVPGVASVESRIEIRAPAGSP
jgi:osmotically-inducible protein OsmY